MFAREGVFDEDGAAFQLDNVRLELLPSTGGAEGLADLAFEVETPTWEFYREDVGGLGGEFAAEGG